MNILRKTKCFFINLSIALTAIILFVLGLLGEFLARSARFLMLALVTFLVLVGRTRMLERKAESALKEVSDSSELPFDCINVDLSPGETFVLKNPHVIGVSSDEEVAYVRADGTIIAVKEGTCYVSFIDKSVDNLFGFFPATTAFVRVSNEKGKVLDSKVTSGEEWIRNEFFIRVSSVFPSDA